MSPKILSSPLSYIKVRVHPKRFLVLSLKYTNLGYNILGHKFPSDSLIHILIRVEFPKNILLGINGGVIICKYFSYSYSNRVHHKWFPCYYINSCLNPKNIILALTMMQIH